MTYTRLILILGFALILILFCSQLQADTQNNGKISLNTLNTSEKQWLQEHPEITIGVMDSWAPFSFIDHDGQMSGIGIGYVNAINKRLGNKLHIIPGAWSRIYEEAKENRIDALLDITPTKSREEFFNFTSPYMYVPHVIVAPKNAELIENENDLKGKIIALEESFVNVPYFREKFPQITIKEYKNTKLALDAVVRGEANAYVGNRTVALLIMEQEVITTLKIHSRLEKERSVLAIGTRKDYVVLRDIIQKALDDISREEKQQILGKWITPEENKNKSDQINFTEKEKQWLQQNPVIRVSNEPDWPPFDYIESGVPTGVSTDYMNLIAEKIGVKFEYVTAPWTEILERFKKKEIDLVHPILYTEDRHTLMDFSDSYLTLYDAVVMKQGEEFITELKDFKGKTIAAAKDWIFTKHLQKNHPDIKLKIVNNAMEGLKAVRYGEADAWIDAYGVSSYLIKNHLMTDLRIVGEVQDQGKIKPSNYRIGIRKDWPMLRNIINKALASLTKEEKNQINEKWRVFLEPTPKVLLNATERAWLMKHSIIKIAIDRNFVPVEYIDENGQFQGILSDYLANIEDLLGVKFEIISDLSWQQALKSFENGEIDVIGSAQSAPRRDKFMNFTSPYLTLPLAIYTQSNLPYVGDMKELNGKTIGVVEDYAVHEILSLKHPEIKLKTGRNVEETLNQFSKGEIDAYMGTMLVTGYYIGKLGLTNVNIAGESPYKYELCLGVRKDWKLFTNVLNRAFNEIQETERRKIYDRWIGVRYVKGFDYALFWKIILGVFLLLAVFLFWNRRLSQEVDKRKRAERETRKHAAQLEIAKDQAESADRLKSAFLASMSHELRTPLNSIIGFTGILIQELAGPLNDEQKKQLGMVRNSSNHLLSLINDVLDISKIEAGQLQVSFEDFDLHQTIEDAVNVVAPLADKKSLDLTVDIHPGIGAIISDQRRVKQILINLINNAIKFTEEGNVHIKAGLDLKTDRVVIEVKDTGIGIKPDDMNILFKPFQQVDTGIARVKEGTGLGLAICQKLLRMLGGDITVKSTWGKGSSFTFYLPIDTGETNEL